MDYQSQQDFFAWEARSRDTIDFKTVYVDMADDLMAGLLLSQLIYWHLPKKDGTSRMRVSKEGNLWVAKARTEWWAETRLKPRQVDRAGKILVKKGLVFTKKWRFNGSPTTHWRINWNAFLPSLKIESERWKENCNSPKRELQQTKASNLTDETGTSITENVAENVAQIDPPAQIFPLGGSSEPKPDTNPEPSPGPQQVTDPATPGDQPNSDTLTEAQPLLASAATTGDGPPQPPVKFVPGGSFDATITLPEPHEYTPDHISPLGETLLEKIEELGMSHGELARRVGWHEETVSEVIRGEAPVTSEVAMRLERVLGVPAGFWNNRERHYRQHLAQAVADSLPNAEPLPDAEPLPNADPPKRDYLIDLFAYANRDKPGDGDAHVRPKHWETVSDGEYAICRRVADLWCGGRLPFPGSIEAHCGAAGYLLNDLHDGNLGACIRALDEYHRHYEEERMSFTVAGPKSLVAVLPAFLAQGGGGGESGVIQVGG